MKIQYIQVDEEGNKTYFKDKKMTKIHREDGPAFEGFDGYKEWCVNNELHREDGPAIEASDGSKVWFLHNERVSEHEFNKRTAKELVVTLDEVAAKFGVDVSKLKIKK